MEIITPDSHTMTLKLKLWDTWQHFDFKSLFNKNTRCVYRICINLRCQRIYQPQHHHHNNQHQERTLLAWLTCCVWSFIHLSAASITLPAWIIIHQLNEWIGVEMQLLASLRLYNTFIFHFTHSYSRIHVFAY